MNDGYRKIVVGTNEKQDVCITISQANELRIEFGKMPHPRFIEHDRLVVEKILKEEKMEAVQIFVEDFGALDFALQARLRTALRMIKREEC